MRTIWYLLRLPTRLATALRAAASHGSDEPIHLTSAAVLCDRDLNPNWKPSSRTVIRTGVSQ